MALAVEHVLAAFPRESLEPGDVLVLYSDGITDHLSFSGEDYGRGRLAKVLRESCNLTAQEIIDAIFTSLDRFNRALFDDQTLIVLKVK